MHTALLALLLAQLALPGQASPGGLVYPLGADLAAPGSVYQLGPVGTPSLSWTPAVGVYTSPITPTVGPQLTFTRASAATYEPGTGTVNVIQAPTQMGASPWQGVNSGASAITATSNAAVAPDGTSTAAQLVLPAVSSGQYSVWGIVGLTLPAGSYTWSVQLKASSGTASTYLYAYNTSDGAYLGNTLCSLTTTWSTCSVSFTLAATKTINVRVGTDASPGSGMSATSAATVYGWNATLMAPGTMAYAESGRLRCGATGCLVEPPRTNYLPRSEDISHGAWTTYGSLTVAGTACLSADGTVSGTRLTTASGYSSRFQGVTLPATKTTAAQLDVSSSTGSAQSAVLEVLWGASDTATCTCSMSDGSACTVYTLATECYAQASTSSTTPVHLRLLVATAATHTAFTFAVGPGTITPGTNGTVCLGGADLQVGTWMTSHIPNGSSATTRVTDVLSVPSSVLGSGSASLHLVLTPEWASSVDSTLVSSTTANELVLATVSGALDWLVGGNDVTTSALGWSAGTAQTLDAWYTPGGQYRVTDGTHSASGSSASTPSPGTPLYLGGTSSAGSGVAISQVKVCKRAGTCR